MQLELINCISRKLDKSFENTKIYVEQVKQGFSYPCFCIRCVKTEEKRFISNRYKLFNRIEITYYPNIDEDEHTECNRILEKLYYEFLKLEFKNGIISGENMEGFIEDRTLKFYVNFDFYIFRKDNLDKMKKLFV